MGAGLLLSAVFVLVAAILIIVAVILVAVLIFVLVFILIHVMIFLPAKSYGIARLNRLPIFLGFILRGKENRCNETSKYCNGNSTGTGLQTSGEDAQKTIFHYGIPYTLGQCISESR